MLYSTLDIVEKEYQEEIRYCSLTKRKTNQFDSDLILALSSLELYNLSEAKLKLKAIDTSNMLDLEHSLTNLFCTVQPKLLAISNTISFANPKAPLYPCLAQGKLWNEMAVTWTSGYGIEEATPIVEWGFEGEVSKFLSAAGTLTYTRNMMCGINSFSLCSFPFFNVVTKKKIEQK